MPQVRLPVFTMCLQSHSCSTPTLGMAHMPGNHLKTGCFLVMISVCLNFYSGGKECPKANSAPRLQRMITLGKGSFLWVPESFICVDSYFQSISMLAAVELQAANLLSGLLRWYMSSYNPWTTISLLSWACKCYSGSDCVMLFRRSQGQYPIISLCTS